MMFAEMTAEDRITYTKREFSAIVRNIFENPETLKTYISDKKLSNDQSKVVLAIINKLNSKTCACCRKFDATKLKVTPIEAELEPLLDIAQVNVKSKSY